MHKIEIDLPEKDIDLIHVLTSELKIILFGCGEWVEEPDIAKFIYQGIKCMIQRTPMMGHFCGYVYLSMAHPWCGKGYDIDCDVHGGITYNEQYNDHTIEIGFDCAHSGDISPASELCMRKSREELKKQFPQCSESPLFNFSYKNIHFAINECKKLTVQANVSMIKDHHG